MSWWHFHGDPHLERSRGIQETTERPSDCRADRDIYFQDLSKSYSLQKGLLWTRL